MRAIRSEWPRELPVAVRVSGTDWVNGGWAVDDTIALSRRLSDEGADMVLLAREELRDPYWPLHAARALGESERVAVPVQYGRAFAGRRSPGVRGQS